MSLVASWSIGSIFVFFICSILSIQPGKPMSAIRKFANDYELYWLDAQLRKIMAEDLTSTANGPPH